MDNFQEQLFEMIGRLRQNGQNNQSKGRSKAAAVIKAPCDMMVANNPDRNKGSKAASVTVTGINKAKAIYDFITSNGELV